MRASLVLVVLICLLLPLATPARAADVPPGELGLLFGISRLDRDVVGPGRHPDYSPVYGMRFGTSMNQKYSYFLEGLYGRFDSMVERKTAIFEARGGVERNVPLGGSLSDWYLAGALGYADVNQPGGALGDFGRPLVSAGIGIRGPSAKIGRLHAELREEWWLGDDGISGFDVANTQLLVGLSWGLPGENNGRHRELFKKGKTSLVLEGVNFITDSSELTPGSRHILDRVAESLEDRPEVEVEVEGHTDSVADPAYNMDLSQRRAESVRAYLVSRGVSERRLTARGYGETRPVASNATAQGRAKNRRVELRKTN